MGLQRSHGRLFPLVSRADELPDGVAAPAVPVERRQDGRIASAEAAKELGKRGGQKSARRRADARAWGSSLGLGRLIETFKGEEALAPFVSEGESWYGAQCEALAADVGGGRLSPGVTSIVRTAAWERLYSAWLFDCGTRAVFAWSVLERDGEGKARVTVPRVELLAMAARLGDSSRQNLIAAHELAAKEASARPRRKEDAPWLR